MSKLGIMQPYFFPYLGYYSLIANTDRFVLLDAVQFIRHGWIERNRILKPQEGWQYVSVPLEKFPLGTKIREVRIRDDEDWRGKLVRQLDHYKKRAPFYQQAVNVVRESIAINTNSIVELNRNVLNATCQYIGMDPKIVVYSELGLDIDPVTHPGEWALNISKALGATEYVNPTGGVDIFRPDQFRDANIKLSFVGNNLPQYPQRREGFESGLSIIDVMMFNAPENIKRMLSDTHELSHAGENAE